jgi:hypothetical protein
MFAQWTSAQATNDTTGLATDAYIGLHTQNAKPQHHIAFKWEKLINQAAPNAVEVNGSSTLAWNNGFGANFAGGVPVGATTVFTWAPILAGDLPKDGAWYGRSPTGAAVRLGAMHLPLVRTAHYNYDGTGWNFTASADTPNWSLAASEYGGNFDPHEWQLGFGVQGFYESTMDASHPSGRLTQAPDGDGIATIQGWVGNGQYVPDPDHPGQQIEQANWFGIALKCPKSGDANTDDSIDFADLVTVSQHYNQTVGAGAWGSGDFNGDGVVDFNDLVKVSQNYNTTYGWDVDWGPNNEPPSDYDWPNPLPAANLDLFNRDAASLGLPAVPEPTSMGVLLVGTLICCRRKHS